MCAEEKRGMGWLRDYPDIRDYTANNDKIQPMLKRIGLTPEKKPKMKLSGSVDLRDWCSPIENQLTIGSCTAHAGVGMVEYFERRACGEHIDASRLFLYKVTRNLMHATGDTGGYLRQTMAALVLFGVPPEEYWTYDVDRFDEEPPAFCYAFAQNYNAIEYLRLDPPGTAPQETLNSIKTNLAAGLPSMFGFTVYNSIHQAASTGQIPMPSQKEYVVGGHAIMAVGFDDALEIRNVDASVKPSVGALLIRNSWGTGWGQEGYGWLPYDYVLTGLAVDWWTLLKNEWVNTGNFG